VQIDGDWIWTMLKAESGAKLPSDAIHQDMMDMAYGMVVSGRNSVVAHVIRPHEFAAYEEYMAARGVPLVEVVLQPTEAVAIARSVERKCWPKPTPEYWVRFFRDEFESWEDTGRIHILDNSNATPDATASTIATMADRCTSQSQAT
jgi:predicted kinase